MAVLEGGPVFWKGSRDREGHREYQIQFKVRCESTEGPATAIQTPGLPLPGDLWIHDDDVDVYAWCKNEVEIEPDIEGEKNTYFRLTYTYSTKPDRLCQDYRIEDPLMEPQRIRGSFNKYQETITRDRHGKLLVNHAYEPITGDVVTFDANRPALQIEQNVLELEFDLLCSMIDCVNSEPLWELPTRSIKLSDVTWERHYHGACNCYFKRTFVFDVNVKVEGSEEGTSNDTLTSGFDRDVLLRGTLVLNGYWDETTGHWQLLAAGPGGLSFGIPRNPDPYNPSHYIRAVDRKDKDVTISYDGRPDHRGEPYDPEDVTEYIDCTPCSDEEGGAAETFLVYPLTNVGAENLPLYLEHFSGLSQCSWRATLYNEQTLELSVVPWADDPDAPGTFHDYWTIILYYGPQDGTLNGMAQVVWALAKDEDSPGFISGVTPEFSCISGGTFEVRNDFLLELFNQGTSLGTPYTGSDLTLTVPDDSEPAILRVEHYPEADFTRLNIPLTLDCNS